jgi:hypothetical protein
VNTKSPYIPTSFGGEKYRRSKQDLRVANMEPLFFLRGKVAWITSEKNEVIFGIDECKCNIVCMILGHCEFGSVDTYESGRVQNFAISLMCKHKISRAKIRYAD